MGIIHVMGRFYYLFTMIIFVMGQENVERILI